MYYLLPDGDANYSCTWIEGVGSTEGLFSSYNWGYYNLECCTSKGAPVAAICDLCYIDCPPRDTTTAIEEEEEKDDFNYTFNIYPNPTSYILKINSHNNPNLRRPVELLIYDLSGRGVLFRKKLTAQYTNSPIKVAYVNLVDISQLPINLFIVKVIFDNGDYELKKILKK